MIHGIIERQILKRMESVLCDSTYSVTCADPEIVTCHIKVIYAYKRRDVYLLRGIETAFQINMFS